MVGKWGRNIDFHMLPTVLANTFQETFTTDLDLLMNPTSGLLGTKTQTNKNQFNCSIYVQLELSRDS